MKAKAYSSIQKAKELLSWLPRASSEYKLDSPFLFDFHKKVVQRTVQNDERIDQIEHLRNEYLSNQNQIVLTDYGAGSYQNSGERSTSISRIARSAVSDKRKCHLLYNVAQFFQPSNILELGTSLGISTLYLKASNPKARVTTIEGDPMIAQIFEDNRPDWAREIRQCTGRFSEVIPKFSSNEEFDLIYVDGGHHSNILFPLLDALGPHMTQQSVLIIDDIYWSKDMKASWYKLKESSDYNISLDLWYFGILCLDKRQKERIDVSLSPIKLWWQMGFFR